jgi:hypothetical protein
MSMIDVLSTESRLHCVLTDMAAGSRFKVRMVECSEDAAATMSSIVSPAAMLTGSARPGSGLHRSAEHLAAVAELVRAVRRKQPPKRSSGFVRRSGWTTVGPDRVFVLWGLRPQSLPASSSVGHWFADWTIESYATRRPAGIFASEGARLPVLAFEPVESGNCQPERLYLWSIVDPLIEGAAR